MITGELKSKVDSIWDTLWTGGITSPITVLEQVTYLMFMKLLDDTQIQQEAMANALGTTLKKRVFGDGICVISENPRVETDYNNLRWSVFHNFEPSVMLSNMQNYVFPFIKTIGEGKDTAFSRYMKDKKPVEKEFKTRLEKYDYIGQKRLFSYELNSTKNTIIILIMALFATLFATGLAYTGKNSIGVFSQTTGILALCLNTNSLLNLFLDFLKPFLEKKNALSKDAKVTNQENEEQNEIMKNLTELASTLANINKSTTLSNEEKEMIKLKLCLEFNMPDLVKICDIDKLCKLLTEKKAKE